ncbi:MAG: DinB family protein [Acidobacteriota bacterium]
MNIAQSLLPEFDQEMASTRTMLERVPEDKLSYKPDPKSMSLARLAGHVAEMPGWGAVTMTTDELDFASGDYKPQEMTSRAQILAAFDKTVAESRAAIAATSDERMLQPWSLKNAGTVLFTMPRVAVLRTMVMNHTIHHRGQLSVYLRVNGAKIPGMYGPSADEAMPATAGS